MRRSGSGKAKSTISRDIKAGKISATRNPDGSVSIDPAELHGVYPAVPGLDLHDHRPVQTRPATKFLLSKPGSQASRSHAVTDVNPLTSSAHSSIIAHHTEDC